MIINENFYKDDGKLYFKLNKRVYLPLWPENLNPRETDNYHDELVDLMMKYNLYSTME